MNVIGLILATFVATSLELTTGAEAANGEEEVVNLVKLKNVLKKLEAAYFHDHISSLQPDSLAKILADLSHWSEESRQYVQNELPLLRTLLESIEANYNGGECDASCAARVAAGYVERRSNLPDNLSTFQAHNFSDSKAARVVNMLKGQFDEDGRAPEMTPQLFSEGCADYDAHMSTLRRLNEKKRDLKEKLFIIEQMVDFEAQFSYLNEYRHPSARARNAEYSGGD